MVELKKSTKTFIVYAFIMGMIIVPAVLAMALSDFLLKIYKNNGEHWIAGAFVCLFAGTASAWIPLQFSILLDDDTGKLFPSFQKSNLTSFAIFLGVGGIVGPLIFGFNHLDLILIILLSTAICVSVGIIKEGMIRLREATDKEKLYW